MLAISQYIRTITGAALIGTVVLRLLDGKGSSSAIGKMLVGIFMAVTMLGPITQLHWTDLEDLFPDISVDAEQATSVGQATAQNALRQSISDGVQTYILDKAAQLDVELTVQVELSEDAIPVPVRLRLQGSISPYAKSRLQSIIQNDLGVDKENQIWT